MERSFTLCTLSGQKRTFGSEHPYRVLIYALRSKPMPKLVYDHVSQSLIYYWGFFKSYLSEIYTWIIKVVAVLLEVGKKLPNVFQKLTKK